MKVDITTQIYIEPDSFYDKRDEFIALVTTVEESIEDYDFLVDLTTAIIMRFNDVYDDDVRESKHYKALVKEVLEMCKKLDVKIGE